MRLYYDPDDTVLDPYRRVLVYKFKQDIIYKFKFKRRASIYSNGNRVDLIVKWTAKFVFIELGVKFSDSIHLTNKRIKTKKQLLPWNRFNSTRLAKVPHKI